MHDISRSDINFHSLGDFWNRMLNFNGEINILQIYYNLQAYV